MPEDTSMCLNKLDSEYTSCTKYAKILDMGEFSMGKRYTALWISHNMHWQSSEYISGTKYTIILNMAGFWICKSYTGF